MKTKKKTRARAKEGHSRSKSISQSQSTSQKMLLLQKEDYRPEIEVEIMKYPEWLPHFAFSPEQKEKLALYVQELRVFNKKFNLFSRQQGGEFCWQQILESILVSSVLLKEGPYPLVSDLGAGAGFFGLTLSILNARQKIELFEPHLKKAHFLKHFCWKAGLKRTKIQVLPVQKSPHSICCGVSKAFLTLSQRLKITAPVFKTKAVYYHLQSLSWKKEWEKTPLSIQNRWKLKTENYSFLPYIKNRVLLKTMRV